jgi:hypothetical protein
MVPSEKFLQLLKSEGDFIEFTSENVLYHILDHRVVDELHLAEVLRKTSSRIFRNLM